MWCCRACFLSDQTDIIPGDGTPGAAVVGPDPDDPSVCARAGHPWHNPVHAVDGRSVRPAPQRHGVRRGGSCYLMRCAVAGCTSETCQFAHSDEELAHWRQRLPPPVDHVFHPAVRRALGALEIPVPVTDNIREKINALGLADVLRRLRAPPRRGLRGYAALLGRAARAAPSRGQRGCGGGRRRRRGAAAVAGVGVAAVGRHPGRRGPRGGGVASHGRAAQPVGGAARVWHRTPGVPPPPRRRGDHHGRR